MIAAAQTRFRLLSAQTCFRYIGAIAMTMGRAVDQDQVLARLTPIFHEVLDNDSLVLSRTLTAGDVDEWDSLSHIRLIVAIEQAFGVSFRSTEVGNLDSLGDMVDLILKKLE